MVASTLLLPWAMLAKGPPWTKAGCPSKVCTRFGIMASTKSAAMEPAAPKSLAQTGPPLAMPIKIFPSLSLRSSKLCARHKMAITSDAAVMSKPLSRTMLPTPVMISLRLRSFMSRTRRQVMVLGSKPSLLPLKRWLSTSAARRLWAAATACMSPVKWRLISSMGTSWA